MKPPMPHLQARNASPHNEESFRGSMLSQGISSHGYESSEDGNKVDLEPCDFSAEGIAIRAQEQSVTVQEMPITTVRSFGQNASDTHSSETFQKDSIAANIVEESKTMVPVQEVTIQTAQLSVRSQGVNTSLDLETEIEDARYEESKGTEQERPKLVDATTQSVSIESSCNHCVKVRSEVHSLREKNIALRDECRKLRSKESKLVKEKQDATAMGLNEILKAQKNYDEYRERERTLTEAQELIEQYEFRMAKLKKDLQEKTEMLSETLVVKLRYEQIIKNALANEKRSNPKPLDDIIARTKQPEAIEAMKHCFEV